MKNHRTLAVLRRIIFHRPYKESQNAGSLLRQTIVFHASGESQFIGGFSATIVLRTSRESQSVRQSFGKRFSIVVLKNRRALAVFQQPFSFIVRKNHRALATLRLTIFLHPPKESQSAGNPSANIFHCPYKKIAEHRQSFGNHFPSLF